MLRLVLALLLLLQVPFAEASGLKLLVDQSTEMPFARIRDRHAVEGIYIDIGRLLAQRLQRDLTVHATPRQRISHMLRTGQGDIACALLPEWLKADVHWTEPFIPHDGVVVTVQSAPRPERVIDLANQPIGTVLGFAYPELEQGLQEKFVRDNAPTAGAMLKKLDRGRTAHAAVNLQFLLYQRRIGGQTAALHPFLHTGGYLTRCAVSKNSDVKVEDLDRAIKGLIGDGSIGRVMLKYQ